jgi:hypothetical protein
MFIQWYNGKGETMGDAGLGGSSGFHYGPYLDVI